MLPLKGKLLKLWQQSRSNNFHRGRLPYCARIGKIELRRAINDVKEPVEHSAHDMQKKSHDLQTQPTSDLDRVFRVQPKEQQAHGREQRSSGSVRLS